MSKLFRRILVPHDGSDHATRALAVAIRMAVESGGRLIVLRATAPFLTISELGAEEETPWIPPEDIVAQELAGLEKIVRKALPARGAPPVETRVVVADAGSAIIQAAAEADLIVMSTHGRSGLEHLVIGSVAEKVVRHSPIPVLTVRKETAPGVSRRAAPRRKRAPTRRRPKSTARRRGAAARR